MQTDTLIQIMIAVAVLILAGSIAWLAFRSLRSRKLRQKFGPEYDYAIEKAGDRRTAEEMLAERERRVNSLDIRRLDLAERDRYHKEWIGIQADFVDDPAKSVEKTDGLITEIMILRGFPVADFGQRAEDISVAYPEFVKAYRSGHEIALKNQDGEASTEELRQAMVYYRAVIEQLLETEEAEVKEVAV